MISRSASQLLLVVCALGRALPAFAAEAEPNRRPPQASGRAELALVTGFLLAGGSVAAGGLLLTVDKDLDHKHAGLAIMDGGLVLAPLLSHAVAGEWLRGAVFSLPPALAALGMVVLLGAHPDAPVVGKHRTQFYYPGLITLSVVGGVVGVVDAALVDERASSPVCVTAHASREFTGASVEGVW
jgi:hypothetical protein